LDLWEGRANPWQLWPPKPADTPRKVLIQRLIDDAEKAVHDWKPSADNKENVFNHLALAIMNDEIGRAEAAVNHYEAARDLLSKLAASDSRATQYTLALADSYRQLGRLRLKKDRTAAAGDIEQARKIGNELTTREEDPRIHAMLLELELESAVLPGFSAAGPHLDRAQQLSEQLEKKIPSGPVRLYELACSLAGREPVLITRQPTSKPD
jgi:hypothetical protein